MQADTPAWCNESSRHQYLVLPPGSRSRWWVPVRSGRMVRNSLSLYTPYSSIGGISKALARRLLRVPGVPRLVPGRIRGSPERLHALLPRVQEVFGSEELAFAIRVGAPGRFQKLTVQVMNPTGDILGFVKLPSTSEAEERVRHEASVLESLADPLAGSVPEVRLFTEEAGFPALMMTPGPEGRGPVKLEGPHRRFLDRLHDVDSRREPGSAVIHRMERRLAGTADLSGGRWHDGLRWADHRLENEQVRVGWVHGDFAPWNTRWDGRELYVFDWERAASGRPVVWDTLHFVTQAASLLDRAWRLKAARRSHPEYSDDVWKALVILYLLRSAVDLIQEGSPDQDRGVVFRRDALVRLLG